MARADRLQAWQVDDAQFPVAGSPADVLVFALQYAVLAPSSHNSQPWLFHVAGAAVEIYADRTRRLPVVDPDDRELVISCACALFNLRLALSHFRVGHQVVLLPDGEDSDVLARVELTGGKVSPDPAVDEMFAAISHRHTCRHAFFETPIDAQVHQRMHAVAAAEGARLVDVLAADRSKVTSLVTEADFVQMSNPAFRRELAHWMRANRPVTNDGIPGYALDLSQVQSVVGPLIVRTFDVGTSEAAKHAELARGSALLAVLVTPADRTVDWIAAGQALEALLLTATAADVQASFLNQPIEISSMRLQLVHELALSGTPQLLLRFGYGQGARPTPRRQVADVLMTAEPSDHASRRR